ncbi:hypothetical protein GX441_04130 [bacterium]|nr:hypothetical protein [bacterium]
MHLTLISFLLTVTVIGNAKSQAEVLLSCLTQTDPMLYSSLEDFDASGNLWFISKVGKNLYATKISPKGELIFSKILLFTSPKNQRVNIGTSRITFDRWENAYFLFSSDESDNSSEDLHFIRVSSNGVFNDYYPWPRLANASSYKTVLPGDTLMLIGSEMLTSSTKIEEFRWVMHKALLDQTGLTPISQETYDYRLYPYHIMWTGRYGAVFTDWIRRFGLNARIKVNPHESNDRSGEIDLIKLDLNIPHQNTSEPLIDTFSWRKYIWRTYQNACIGYMTFAPFKNEGYVLYIPDPDDSTLSHAILFDTNFVLLEPSELKGGGSRYPKNFDLLPTDAERHSSFRWRRDCYGNLIEAQVLFWGSDNYGNLYTFKKMNTMDGR